MSEFFAFPPELVLNSIENSINENHFTLCPWDSRKFKLTTTLRSFYYNGIVCETCKTKASHFSVKETIGDYSYLELYGLVNNRWTLFTKDHIIPSSKGGTNNIVNFKTMCHHCNNSKADILDVEYYYHTLDIKSILISTLPQHKDAIRKLIRKEFQNKSTMTDEDVQSIGYHVFKMSGKIIKLSKLPKKISNK